MKRFDEQFAAKVKQSFSNYTADHLADAGWKAFQQKQGKQNRLLIAFPLWAKAASVTILLAIGSYTTYLIIQKPKQAIIVENIKEPIVDKQDAVTPPETVKEIVDSQIAEVKTPKEKIETNRTWRKAEKIENFSVAIMPADSSARNTIIPDSTVILAQVEETITQIVTGDSVATNQPNDAKEITNQVTTLPVVAQTLTDQTNMPEKDHRLSLSAGLSGMVARVEDMISTAPAVAIGLYAEQRITDWLSVRPGLALAKHTYGLENFSGNEDFANAPTLDGVSGEVIEYDNHLDIIAMEIPLNFVFNLSKKRDRTLFVSAGTSTMIYLNQHFTGSMYSRYSQDLYNEATGVWENSTSYTRITIDNQYGAFSRTDFFGLANLSAGYAFPFGKKSTMLIEPFVQIPVNKLTSSDLKLRFGGISIKYKLN